MPARRNRILFLHPLVSGLTVDVQEGGHGDTMTDARIDIGSKSFPPDFFGPSRLCSVQSGVQFENSQMGSLPMIIRYRLTFPLLVLLSSCTSDVANRYYSATRYPPVEKERVEILTSAPSKPYEVIADFQSRSDTANSLRAKAAKIGADAVIVTFLGGYSALNKEWADQKSYSDTYYSRIVGTAIRYKR